ncbi:sensor histidine kinase [Halalkalibacter urbisdiaboli]|uniref:sensor histidine kinase n=1 Tax=Halalkalibacter urbisdiaboli TaxID=1960589 RepID=UPI001FDAAF4B|nr:ATP-binding protein [Halalkalibacter urbisdiaboli]
MKFMKNMSFRNKILAVLLLTTVLLSSFSFILIKSIDEIKQVSKEIETRNIPELIWLSHWEEELAIKEHLVKSYIDNDFCCYFIESYETYKIESSDQIALETTYIPISLEQIKTQIDLLDFMITNNVRGLVAIGDNIATKNYLEEQYLPQLEKLKQDLNEKQQSVFISLNRHSSHFSSIITESLWLLLLLTSAALILSFISAYRISVSLTKPVERMVEKVNRIAQGEYGLTIAGAEQIELQQLTNSINQMSAELKESFHTIMNDKVYREQILNSLPVGIITFDEKTDEVSLNQFAKHILGSCEKMVLNPTNATKNSSFWGLLASNEIIHNIKVIYQSNEGMHSLLVSQTKLLDEGNEIIGRIFYFIDITETEELEKRMHHSEKLAYVGELAAGAAHEIRNPLAVIDGFFTIMNQALSEPEKKQFHFPLLMMELKRINSIVEEMLLLTKPSAPNVKIVYLEGIINEILPLIQQSTGNEEINFNVNVERELLTLDDKQMKQVFYNLIRNSVDAMEGKGEISIYSKTESDYYTVFIKDSGKGIPSDLQAAIFDPFLTSKENGTGLGLTIVQRIMDNHNGYIELYSSTKAGTTFKLALPRTKE